jgi:heme A synthase
VVVQVTLGALTVLTKRDVWINSVHLVCGALVLATSIVIALRAWRVRFSVAEPSVDQTRELADRPQQPAQAAVEPSGARA